MINFINEERKLDEYNSESDSESNNQFNKED